MKNVRRYFALTMLLWIVGIPAYAGDISRDPLALPCDFSQAGQTGAVLTHAWGTRSAEVVKFDLACDPAPQRWSAEKLPRGRGDEQPVNPYMLHADLHVGRHVRLGAGYNFDGLSEEPAEFEIVNEGLFIYLIGQM